MNGNPTPRLVPDRPSDAAIAQAFWKLAKPQVLGEVVASVGVDFLLRIAREIDAAAPPAEAPAERGNVASIVECVLHKTYMESADYRVTTTLLHDMARDVAAALAQLAAAPAAPAEGDALPYAWAVEVDFSGHRPNGKFLFTDKEEADAYHEWRQGSCNKPTLHALYTAPRVAGGREAQDAARYTWLRCGGWEVMQDPAMWPEALRFDGAIDAAMALVALQAATGGEVES